MKRVLIVLLFFVLSPSLCFASDRDLLKFLVVPFDGPKPLATSVWTVVYLQIWRTLRKAPDPNPSKLSFGDGLVDWDEVQPAPITADAAIERARKNNAQLVLWGDVYPYQSALSPRRGVRDDALVQAQLLLPQSAEPRAAKPETWRVTLHTATGNDEIVEADIPQRAYSFDTVVIPQTVADLYSQPWFLTVYRSTSTREPIGAIGDTFWARRHLNEWTQVELPGRKVGWVRLPKLDSSSSDLVNFCAGVIRAFRGDWGGTVAKMKLISKSTTASWLLKIDSYLYQALAKEKQGASGQDEIAAALALNPLAARVAIYAIMSKLAQYQRDKTAHKTEAAEAVLKQLRQIIDRSQELFDRDDPWYSHVANVVGDLK